MGMHIKKEMRRDMVIAGLALAVILLMPTTIMPLIAAAAAETGIGLVAFAVAYAFWAGSCLYNAYNHNITGAEIDCVIGFIPVL